MPQDTSQNYYYPDGTRGIPNETIESEAYNNFLDDLKINDLNIARPIHRGGTGATTADQALVNLSAEKSTQIVTNYDSHVWVPGSFRSTNTPGQNAPVDGHAFAGICYINEPLANPPTNQNVTVSARDMNDTIVPGRVYARQKKAGVWDAWNGLLTLSGNPTEGLHAATKQYVDEAIAAVIAIVVPPFELRFTRSVSQHMTRLFDTASGTLAWTMSMWVKRVGLGTHQALFGVETVSSKLHIGFTAGNAFALMGGPDGTVIINPGLSPLVDTNLWIHIVWQFGAGALGASRLYTVYVNNNKILEGLVADPAGMNSAITHYIGQPGFYPDLIMKEVVFVDGVTAPPTAFGEYFNGTGSWIQKAYTGTYGLNGFRLNFAKPYAPLPVNLGTDVSSNSNHWTAVNF